jgi:hypothetical protein
MGKAVRTPSFLKSVYELQTAKLESRRSLPACLVDHHPFSHHALAKHVEPKEIVTGGAPGTLRNGAVSA